MSAKDDASRQGKALKRLREAEGEMVQRDLHLQAIAGTQQSLSVQAGFGAEEVQSLFVTGSSGPVLRGMLL